MESEKWAKVHCVVRKEPEDWAKLHNKEKLSVQVEADLDKLKNTEDWKLNGYDAMFVCFGSQVKHGE